MAFDPVHGNQSQPASLVIKIRAPWWRRWWFFGLCALVVAALVALAWRLRVSLLLRQQRRLEQMVRDRTAEIEQARCALLRQATCDSLTGLSNRHAIMAMLKDALSEVRQCGSRIAVLLLDVDHFKRINDTWGHLAGDAVLQQLAGRLQEVLRPGDAVGRYGGEEFLLILSDPGESMPLRLAAMSRTLIELPYDLGEISQVVTVSGGLAWIRSGETIPALIARADTALYDAKRQGRNRILLDGAAPGVAADMEVK